MTAFEPNQPITARIAPGEAPEPGPGRRFELGGGWTATAAVESPCVRLHREGQPVATAQWRPPPLTLVLKSRRLRRGVELAWRAPAASQRAPQWRLWLRASDQADALVVIERSALPDARLLWLVSGRELSTHRGLRALTLPVSEATFRMGPFTQYGQLLDLVDYVLVRHAHDEQVRGLLLLRPGHWTQPHLNVGTIRGDAGEELTWSLPGDAHGQALRRSYAIAAGPARELLRSVALHKGGSAGRHPWPAERIARLGFARPERLASCARSTSPSDGTSSRPIFDDDALIRARRLAAHHPDTLGGHPVWRSPAEAMAWTWQTLTEAQAGLRAGPLDPGASPVALRKLGPAMAAYHLLDLEGRLCPAQRQQGAVMIAEMAELLRRRDYYPWHVAHIPPSARGSVEPLYRGMLNQNFNTDRYAAVGLAGCVLAHHPHARRWRQHFLDQFHAQMRRWVYPGGAWEESHTYHQHVLLCLLPLLKAFRAIEGVDLLNEPRFADMAAFFVDWLSPPESAFGGRRVIPPLGDHGHPRVKPETFTYLFGWLAALWPSQRERMRWAWRATGLALHQPGSDQACVWAPLLTDDPAGARAASSTPSLPTLLERPGCGVAARFAPHQPDEALLVVRCGEAWGHYHADQGSFWWWHGGALVCADAGLGEGPFKRDHAGHNTLGYPGREPMQHLDRTPYRVTRALATESGFEIECDIPVPCWRTGHNRTARAEPPPRLKRVFRWPSAGELFVDDEPADSPEGVVVWRVWVVATHARPIGPTRWQWSLADQPRVLQLDLPCVPRHVELLSVGPTLGLSCLYSSGPLVHRLALI